MRLLPRLFAVIAACAAFPAAHAACTPATIKGYFAASMAGSYASAYPAVGVGHVYFNGVNAITVTSYKEGNNGDVQPVLTGAGTYQIDQWCRGVATISLKQNGVAVSTISLAFTVSGTPTSPQIQALVSSPVTDFTGALFLNKINL